MALNGTISFISTAANDPPEATNLNAVISYAQNDVSVVLPDIVVSDVDTGDEVTITITLSDPLAGALTISGNATYNAGTGVWSCSGLVVDVNVALAEMVYQPASGYSSNFTAAVSLDDGDEDSSGPVTGTWTFQGQAGNTAPSATNLTASVNWAENAASVALPDIVVSDIDIGEIISASLTLSDPTAGVLTTPGTSSYDTPTGVWFLSGSVAEVNTALANVAFIPSTDYNQSFAIYNVIDDGDEDGSGALAGTTTMIATTASNVAPTASNLTTSVNYTEDGVAVQLDTIEVVDPDVGDIITATRTLSDPLGGVLTTVGLATYTPGTGVWTVTGTVAQVNEALADVEFVPAQDYNLTLTITNIIDDGDEDSSGPLNGVTTLVGTAVNDAPTATNLTSTSVYNQGDASVAIADIVVSDIDVGESITATLTLLHPSYGALSTSGAATYNAGTGEWQIVGTPAEVTAALAAMAFLPASGTDQNTGITVSISDGEAAPLGGLITLSVIPNPTTGGMLLGVNAGNIDYWSEINPFANLIWNSAERRWRENSPTGNVTYSNGNAISTNSNDEFWKVLVSADGLSPQGMAVPAGTYTIINPNNAQVRIFGSGANISSNDYSSYSTADRGTFTLVDVPEGITGPQIYILGDTTGVAVIMPGHVTSWDGGNVWNADFLSYMSGLGMDHIRFMDWNVTNGNFSEDWAHRIQPGWGTLSDSPLDYGSSGAVPYEYMIDLCNRLQVNPWITIPTRACENPAYTAPLATMLNNDLDPALEPYVEGSNETWNPQFNDAFNYPRYLNHTARYMTFSPGGICTLNNHGFSNGDLIASFATPGGRSKENVTNHGWTLWNGGVDLRVVVINSNQFRVWYDQAGGGAAQVQATSSNTCTYMIYDIAETTRLSTAAGTAKLTMAAEAVMRPILGSRMKMMAGTQSANSGVTATQFSEPGFAAAIDYLATAPYMHGEFWVGMADVQSGSITPQMYSHRGGSGRTVSFYLFPAGALKTEEEVLIGSGLIGSRTNVSLSSNTTVSASQFSGLTNGNSYDLYYHFDAGTQDANGYTNMMRTTITVNAGVGTVYRPPDNQDVANTFLVNLNDDTMNRLAGHLAVSQGVKIFTYEGGQHNWYRNTEFDLFWGQCMESPEMGAILTADWHTHAAHPDVIGMTLFDSHGNEFEDAWGLGTSNYDTSDGRYLAFAAESGDVPRGTTPLGTPFTFSENTDPGSFPHVLGSLPENDVTYTVIKDPSGIVSASGQSLVLTADTAINWNASKVFDVFVKAVRGNVISIIRGTVTLGGAGGGGGGGGSGDAFAVDAYSSWNAVDDDLSSIDDHSPAISGTSVAGATKTSEGMWELPDTVGSHELIAAAEPGALNWATKDWAIILTGEAAAAYDNGEPLFEISQANNWRLRKDYSGGYEWFGWMGTGITQAVTTGPSNSTPESVWLHYNHTTGTLTQGTNQTNGGSQSVTIGTDHNPGGNKILTLYNNGTKIAGYQVVFRDNLSVAECRALALDQQTELFAA